MNLSGEKEQAFKEALTYLPLFEQSRSWSASFRSVGIYPKGKMVLINVKLTYFIHKHFYSLPKSVTYSL